MLVNAAGVSPSQAPIEAILKVDLYGTAVLLEEVGKVVARGGVGVTISSQSGWRMPALTAEQDEKLATTPTEELLSLDFLQPENIRDTLHAYQMAKRCNEKRATAQAVEWGKRGARLNDIAPGIIVTPLALLLTGYIIHDIGLKNVRLDRDLGIAMIFRFLLAPALSVALCRAFGVTGLAHDVLIVETAMPVVTQTVVAAAEYGADEEFAAQGAALSTIACFVVIPVLMLIL